MANPTVRLTGWKAVAVLVLLLGFVGFRWVTARSALDSQGREALEQWIALELQRPMLADTTGDPADRAQDLLSAGKVRIRSMSAHGPLDNMVVRVELEPSADLPAGTELTRYYRMQYSSLTGWRHRGNATALSWYLAIL
jgi:hypothetical protein